MSGADTLTKRRRLHGSCDLCKRKKTRCDSSVMPNSICTNCTKSGSSCTHGGAKENEDPSAFSEDRIKAAQEYVSEIVSPSTVYVPSGDPETSHRILVEVAHYARSLEERLAVLQPQTSVPSLLSPSSDQDGEVALAIEPCAIWAFEKHDSSENGSFDGMTKKYDRYYGKSSSAQFVRAAMKHIQGGNAYVFGVQRPDFWQTRPWERIINDEPPLLFPDHDLILTLVHIFFEKIHPLFGILHRATFENALRDGVHFSDRQFGSLLLAVCCVSSRYSDDPRVFTEEAHDEHSCGWKWFKQIRPLRATFTLIPSLLQLQTLALCLLYMSATSNPEEGWVVVGMGVRFCHAAGAHLRQLKSTMSLLEAELYKRLFWLFMISDLLMSVVKGRPSSTRISDVDIDLPLACDEEYWDKPNPVQPPGKPSIHAYLGVYYQLMLLFERIQHAVYPVKGGVCDDEVVAEIDSALNQWVDNIPEHLKWDPQKQQNPIFLDQSTSLYSSYYHAQILLHRAFIPPPLAGNDDAVVKTNFPSLAICANAARACGHICDVQSRRGRGLLPNITVMTALFDSAIVLLINVWAVVDARPKKPRSPEDYARAMADASNCVHVLRLFERRYRIAGRNCDVLAALMNYGKYTLEAATAGPSLKRQRAPEIEQLAPGTGTVEPLFLLPAPNASSTNSLLASHPSSDSYDSASQSGSNSPPTSVEDQMQALEQSLKETDHLFGGLPMHSTELGSLPVYSSSVFTGSTDYPGGQYQPASHLDGQYETVPGLLPPEMLYLAQNAAFDTQEHETQTHPASHQHREPSASGVLNPPTTYSWEAWSEYFTGVDELNQGFF
ncbi:fungal-specific transcription factor domain-containing protein [Mycena amicta]|nr:fungal-specific transcription factor domain-containing protein [Mycena amicta]